jgi:hypothetical protein
MLCDVISVVAEFIVRVLHSRSAIGIHACCWLEVSIRVNGPR